MTCFFYYNGWKSGSKYLHCVSFFRIAVKTKRNITIWTQLEYINVNIILQGHTADKVLCDKKITTPTKIQAVLGQIIAGSEAGHLEKQMAAINENPSVCRNW